MADDTKNQVDAKARAIAWARNEKAWKIIAVFDELMDSLSIPRKSLEAVQQAVWLEPEQWHKMALIAGQRVPSADTVQYMVARIRERHENEAHEQSFVRDNRAQAKELQRD